MKQLPIDTWEVLKDSYSLRSKMASTIFAIKEKEKKEQLFIDEANILKSQGFNEKAILEYQTNLPILLENPAMVAHLMAVDDLENDFLIPDLKNLYDLLNWLGYTTMFNETRAHLCFLLRVKLIDELKDVVSSETLAAINDENLPSSMLSHYFY